MSFARCTPVLLTAFLFLGTAKAETRTLYSEINVTGTVTVTIADAGGKPACANLWWIKRLFGSVQQLGRVCGTKTLEIPSFLGLSRASKLRASADRGTTITLTAKEGVAKTVTFDV